MRFIQCNRCGASVTLFGDEDPHTSLKCDCCPQGRDHDHGQHVRDGGEPCRPVTHIYQGEGRPNVALVNH
jgi:hypothetical protein